MRFTPAELRKLIVPGLLALVLLGGGAALIWWTNTMLVQARQQLAGATAQNAQNRERLARIAEEEREVNEKLAVYRQLQALHILGPERRLEWADAMKRIQVERELPDLRFRVERQKSLVSIPGKPASVDFFASRMKVNVALLHEGDLFGFLDDLRASGNAYYAMQRCGLLRTGVPVAAPNLSPRLNAECDIDLITILDRAAKEPAEQKR